MEKDRLHQQMEFLLEADKAKEVMRQTYISSGKRKENDAEHSWHLALMGMLLNEHANEQIDILRVIKMVLIHDLVEIDAGDTYAYDIEGNDTKRRREVAAAERLFHLLPKDQEKDMWELWEEFEAGKSPEARFALALDKVQPVMLNHAAGGKSWREHGVALEQIIKRNELTPEGSRPLWDYAREMIDENVAKGNIKSGE